MLTSPHLCVCIFSGLAGSKTLIPPSLLLLMHHLSKEDEHAGRTFITFVTASRSGHVPPTISVRDQFARFDYPPSTADTEVSTTDSLYIHQLCRIVFQQTHYCTTRNLCFNRRTLFEEMEKKVWKFTDRLQFSLYSCYSAVVILGQLELLCVVRLKSLNNTD